MESVQLLMSHSNGHTLDYKAAAKLCGVSEQSLQWIDRFWPHIHNKEKLHISKEFVSQWLGRTTGKDMMYNFHDQSLPLLEENKDYWEVKRNDPIVVKYYNSIDENIKGHGNRRRYYICTPLAAKKLMMASTTEIGKQVRQYFAEIEEFSHIMFDYIREVDKLLYESQRKELEVRLQAIQIEREAEKKIVIDLKSDVERLSKDNEDTKKSAEFFTKMGEEFKSERMRSERRESIYIVTTKAYSMDGIFKVGRTQDLKNRLSTMNTGRIRTDKIYVLDEFKTFNSTKLEALIHDILKGLHYGNTREFFRGPYKKIKEIVSHIVDNYNNYIYEVNDVISNIIDSIINRQWNDQYLIDGINFEALEPFALSIEYKIEPDTIDVDVDVDAAITTATSAIAIERKYSIYEEWIIKAIDMCCMDKNDDYKFKVDRDVKFIQLDWKDIANKLISILSSPKRYFNRTEWKKKLVALCSSTKLKLRLVVRSV